MLNCLIESLINEDLASILIIKCNIAGLVI